ncbi:helix-turn-helix transcriptional regulator [Nonomuraea turkmeniaca]|uniref:Helix-turn-helix transcriptional regulator n=1 Tax=Nonomuraea turkmeniaca TaxID=103838 RepID=A0A5S4EUQ3_9ACTN|nr:helix-turn-helix domain-containing protein [Nonomuraea turkmeniaca]TMR04978.1 helix-turn-helix transcriptional regulator [Nonomuraea turkmeniaca]
MAGRPRDPGIDGAVIAAAADLLARQELATLPMEAVAERAGVAKSTVYRRWANGDALLADTVDFLDRPPDQPGASLAEDLARLVESLRPVARLLPSLRLFARRNAGTETRLMALIDGRRLLLEEALVRAEDRGELRDIPESTSLLHLLIAAASHDGSETAVRLLIRGLGATEAAQ